MPDVSEVLAQCQWLVAHGRAGEKAKLLLPAVEARKRVKNTEGRTRLIVQLDTPETYSEFAAQFSRYKEQARNVQVAFSIMLRCLAQLSDEQIRALAADDIPDSLSEA